MTDSTYSQEEQTCHHCGCAQVGLLSFEGHWWHGTCYYIEMAERGQPVSELFADWPIRKDKSHV